ncbi:hypothetical protein GCM10020000_19600 [Streptomyces olivoverticillatus]
MNAPGIRAAAVPPGTAARGGYVLSDAERGTPDVVLVADGAELRTALEARRILQRDGIATRVVAMPCPKWFDEQAPAYRDAVLPPATPGSPWPRAPRSVGTNSSAARARRSAWTGSARARPTATSTRAGA